MAKQNAPNILLEDFNYFANKTILQYINKRYNIYDISQQTTDDLRVLKATAFLDVVSTPYNKYFNDTNDFSSLFMDATYTAELPNDYYHLLNCLCFFKVKHTNKCYDQNTIARFSATRLTADTWSQVVDNYWLKPSYRRPYYYIHNVNIFNPISSTNPVHNLSDGNFTIENVGTDKGRANEAAELLKVCTDIDQDAPKATEEGQYYATLNGKFLDLYISNSNLEWQQDKSSNQTYFYYKGKYFQRKNDLSRLEEISYTDIQTKSENDYLETEKDEDPFKKIDLNGFIQKENDEEVIYPQRNAQMRYGNASKPLIEIRYGEDNSTFELFKIMVDYIKAPQHIRLTQEQIDKTLDTSQVLEFPDYVCQEIINELVKNIMENISDPRLQTFPVVSQSIANPAQQQTPQEQ